MVSHQADHSTSLTLRGPASVAGGGGGGGVGSSGRAGSHVSSRTRRYNRSHAGGTSGAGSAGATSFVARNEFPVFNQSGDVEIVVRVASGHENRYLLHRHTLTRCSGFFEASTSNEWSRAQALPELPPPPLGDAAVAPAREVARLGSGDERGTRSSDESSRVTSVSLGLGQGTPRKRWRYELDPGTGDDDIPMLVQKEEQRLPASSVIGGGGGGGGGTRALPAPTSSIFGGSVGSQSGGRHGRSSSHHGGAHSFFRSVASLSLSSAHTPPPLPPPTQAEEDLLRDYDNLFRIMYNYPPLLDGINIADAYVQCKSLLTLADLYDALAVVGPRVDHHLLQFQSRLWKQIAKYPISYLRLGYLARSKVIFQEALIHVVGQWPAGERSLRAALPGSVLDIIEDKVEELEETVYRVEARLFRLTLTTRSGERVSPATGYLDWLAVSLFRQWLADNTTPPPPPSSSLLLAPPPPPAQDRRHGGSRDGHGSRSGRSGSIGAASATHGRSGGGAVVTFAGLLPTGSSSAAATPLASLGRTYRMLGAASPSAYLSHDECKRFLKLTPELYSRDNLRRFEKRIDELKVMAREVVRPLMGSGLELETGPGASSSGSGSGSGGRDGGSGGLSAASGIAYLTCTNVRDRDLPWVVYN